MRIRCLDCGHLRGEPSASACWTSMLNFLCPLFTFSLLAPLGRRILERAPLERSWPVIVPGALVLLAVTLWCWIPAGILTRWILGRRPCPDCGQRKWSNGFYEGFGL